MSSVCCRFADGNGYHVSMYWDKGYDHTGGFYVVEVCPWINTYMCGYPVRKMTYLISEKQKAERTFKRYIKKYCKEEVK